MNIIKYLAREGKIMKKKLSKSFFIFNPKSYLFGNEIEKMSKVAEELAQKYPNISILLTTPYADIYRASQNVSKAFISAQHIDGIKPGRGMGSVLPESIVSSGASATFINHAEHPLTFDEIIGAVRRADSLGLLTIVCANSIEEARAVATLKPDVILCEPTELIGTGKTSPEDYIVNTNKVIKEISPKTLVMQGAGISRPEDVYNVIKLGADGTGCTSGITNASDPAEMFKDMVKACYDATVEKGV